MFYIFMKIYTFIDIHPVLLQYLGFGSPSNDNDGRRSVTNADLKNYNENDDPVAEQASVKL